MLNLDHVAHTSEACRILTLGTIMPVTKHDIYDTIMARCGLRVVDAAYHVTFILNHSHTLLASHRLVPFKGGIDILTSVITLHPELLR